MSFEKDRLSIRLSLKPEAIEQIFSIISEIDAVKNSWRIAGKLLPQTIERLTHSVIVTSTGASNRIEGNKFTDAQVEALYKNLRIRKFKTRDEQEVAGYFLNILREQAKQVLKILEGDDIDSLLSEKQLDLWRWVNQRPEKTFSRKDAINALGFPPRTIEACIKKLLDLKKITKVGEGRATRYMIQ